MSIEQSILQTCFERFDNRFASGKVANNKLDLDNIETDTPLFNRIVCGMADLIVARHVDVDEIDVFVSIPSGGDRFAEGVSDALAPKHRIPVVYFKKDPSSPPAKKLFLPRNQETKLLLRNARKVVLIDDVTNEYTSTAGMAENKLLIGKALSVCSAVHRGLPDAEQEIDIPKDSLVDIPIPIMLPEDSPLWQYAPNLTAR